MATQDKSNFSEIAHQYALKVMHNLEKHPITFSYQHFTPPQTKVSDLFDLAFVSQKLISNQYQSISDWKNDMNKIPDNYIECVKASHITFSYHISFEILFIIKQQYLKILQKQFYCYGFSFINCSQNLLWENVLYENFTHFSTILQKNLPKKIETFMNIRFFQFCAIPFIPDPIKLPTKNKVHSARSSSRAHTSNEEAFSKDDSTLQVFKMEDSQESENEDISDSDDTFGVITKNRSYISDQNRTPNKTIQTEQKRKRGRPKKIKSEESFESTYESYSNTSLSSTASDTSYGDEEDYEEVDLEKLHLYLEQLTDEQDTKRIVTIISRMEPNYEMPGEDAVIQLSKLNTTTLREIYMYAQYKYLQKSQQI